MPIKQSSPCLGEQGQRPASSAPSRCPHPPPARAPTSSPWQTPAPPMAPSRRCAAAAPPCTASSSSPSDSTRRVGGGGSMLRRHDATLSAWHHALRAWRPRMGHRNDEWCRLARAACQHAATPAPRQPSHRGAGCRPRPLSTLPQPTPPLLQARNAALAKLPADCDLCLGLDLDDQPQVGQEGAGPTRQPGRGVGSPLPCAQAWPQHARSRHPRRPPCEAAPACRRTGGQASQPASKIAGCDAPASQGAPAGRRRFTAAGCCPALQAGWLEALRDLWAKSRVKPSAVRYRYVWRFEPDDVTPGGAPRFAWCWCRVAAGLAACVPGAWRNLAGNCCPAVDATPGLGLCTDRAMHACACRAAHPFESVACAISPHSCLGQAAALGPSLLAAHHGPWHPTGLHHAHPLCAALKAVVSPPQANSSSLKCTPGVTGSGTTPPTR